MLATDTAKQTAHRIRTECEGMLCDNSRHGCRNFATYAIIPAGDPDMVDLACDAHHIENEDGFHIALQPLSPDVAALHRMLNIR